MKKILIVAIFLIANQLSFGQNKGDFIIKYAPSGLVDYYGRYIQFAGEYVLNNGHAIELEGGFVVDEGAWRESPEMVFESGIKFRGGWRKYLDNERFAGIVLSLRDESFSIEGDFLRSGGTYFQRIPYNVDQQQYALLAQLGFQIQLGKRFTLEYSGGAGVRGIVRTYGGVPDDAEFVSNNSTFASYQKEKEEILRLSIFISLKLGFTLIKG